jgi:hypothetical protein
MDNTNTYNNNRILSNSSEKSQNSNFDNKRKAHLFSKNTIVDIFRNDKIKNSFHLRKNKKKKLRHELSGNFSLSDLKECTKNEDEEESLLSSQRLKHLLNIITQSYKEDEDLDSNKRRLTLTKEKVWNIVRKIKYCRKKNIFHPALVTNKKNTSWFIMHPDSYIRILIDSIISILYLIDLIISPYDYFVLDYPYLPRYREIIFDCFFLIDIMTNFFTGFYIYPGNILTMNFREISLNYLKLRFFFNFSYVFPFWAFYTPLIYLRLIKLYKIPYLIRRYKKIVSFIFSSFIRSLKILHSIVSVFCFCFILLFNLHFSSCIWVYIGLHGDPNINWIKAGGLINSTRFDLYLESLYFLTETFNTVGYGDFPPQTTFEILYIMVCQVVNVGLFAYLITCILYIISNFSTDEFNFKYPDRIDMDSWLIEFNKRIPKKMKMNLIRDNDPFFINIKKYFMMFYKLDHSWVERFDFLKSMKPRERNNILEHTFGNFYLAFKSFFFGLNPHFKHKIVINLKTKFYDKNEKTNLIIIENERIFNREENPNFTNLNSLEKKKMIRYFYFIGKGVIGVFKNNIEICRLLPGSYFGDEFLTNKYSTYSYKILENHTYLFCLPVDIISDICQLDEESYFNLLYKTLIKMNKFKILYDELKDESIDILRKRNFSSTNDHIEKLKYKEFKEGSPDSVKRGNMSMINNLPGYQFKIFRDNEQKGNSPSSINEPQDEEQKEKELIKNCSNNLNSQFLFEKNIDTDINIIGDSDLNHINFNFGSISYNEQLNKFLDDQDFLDKIEINEDVFSDLKKAKDRKEKFSNYLKYVVNINNKFEFVKTQVDFLKLHYSNVMNKSKSIVQKIKQNIKND